MARITVSLLRDLLLSLEREQITLSRMAEALNEKAAEVDEKWLSGPVRCSICTHAWIAVRPIEAADKLECPNCGNINHVIILD